MFKRSLILVVLVAVTFFGCGAKFENDNPYKGTWEIESITIPDVDEVTFDVKSFLTIDSTFKTELNFEAVKPAEAKAKFSANISARVAIFFEDTTDKELDIYVDNVKGVAKKGSKEFLFKEKEKFSFSLSSNSKLKFKLNIDELKDIEIVFKKKK